MDPKYNHLFPAPAESDRLRYHAQRAAARYVRFSCRALMRARAAALAEAIALRGPVPDLTPEEIRLGIYYNGAPWERLSPAGLRYQAEQRWMRRGVASNMHGFIDPPPAFERYVWAGRLFPICLDLGGVGTDAEGGERNPLPSREPAETAFDWAWLFAQRALDHAAETRDVAYRLAGKTPPRWRRSSARSHGRSKEDIFAR